MTALVVGVVVALLGAVTVAAQSDDDRARQAAEEIAAARDRANQAAEELFAMESEYQVLDDRRARLETELAELQARVDELRAAVVEVAIDRYVVSGASGIPVLTDVRAPNDQVQAVVFSAIVADSSSTTLDDYEAARVALREKQREVDDNRAQLDDRRADLEALREEAEAEVARLRELERQRLQDVAVWQAVEAQRREEARQLAEIAQRQAEAAIRAAQPAAAAAALVNDSGNFTGNVGSSGGIAGGRTGGGGGGNNPAAIGSGFVDAIICPVQGGSAYADTWGAPRSGGRRHQGVDMLAPTGTPLQAVISGFVDHRSNPLGGITISLMGDNGNRYYYAHLSGYVGLPGRVEQGQVIGLIGDTGNATGVPHLHFEIRPGGGFPVNPTPSVRLAGC
jgi:murein DD-endopeptidase MepM/ murein hydrolase activator NlpD